ncbi:unnamed protein product [Vicia faba]|uniref:Methyltransferase n=1 Tax=Vicia faba TaxID=3906 RepID=A0AAV1A9E0_VICFA|nr:unnamed protein product [Vicia faba]
MILTFVWNCLMYVQFVFPWRIDFNVGLLARWGSDLLDCGILTVSLAPRDNHQAQVQFVLEHDLPVILGVLALHRLPFPSNSFDMAHCSRCLIPWIDFASKTLKFKLQSFTKWSLSSRNTPDSSSWRILGDIAVWQKSPDSVCYINQTRDTYPPKCDDSLEADPTCGSALTFKNDNTSLIDYPVCIMIVVSSYAPNTLPVIYDRGLIGTFHDWCEAFSTYPRTYDLLHLAGLFTAESHRCLDWIFVLTDAWIGYSREDCSRCCLSLLGPI